MADLPAAGWYPDPEHEGQQRYWDGQQWTEHRAPLEDTSSQAPTWDDGTGAQPTRGGEQPSWDAGQPAWGQQQTWGGQQPSWGGQPAWGTPGANPAANVTTWLWQSIVATVLCCLPAGIVGIVFAAQANSAKNMGDVATAREKARIARIWTLVSVGITLAAIVLLFVFGLFGAIVDGSSSSGF